MGYLAALINGLLWLTTQQRALTAFVISPVATLVMRAASSRYEPAVMVYGTKRRSMIRSAGARRGPP
jgi:hypothetical protein